MATLAMIGATATTMVGAMATASAPVAVVGVMAMVMAGGTATWQQRWQCVGNALATTVMEGATVTATAMAAGQCSKPEQHCGG